jgi:hypothetical protein
MPTLPERIRAHLCETAAPITYNALAQAMSLTPPKTIHQVTTALETLMDADVAADHPLIATLVISRSGTGLPAVGFFEHARGLGRFTGDPTGPEAVDFHKSELTAALEFWGNRTDV